ncbi:MAG: class I SAM-dependent methyltransferase, partial [Tagaea sp.]|nr:class I SAM-dependent methyltransferase [Tagaea sp.]
MPVPPHLSQTVSLWVEAHAGLAPAGEPVLDLAAGGGRHARFFAARGHPVVAVDKDVSALRGHSAIEAIQADLEDGSPWPLTGRVFGGVVVTNYLHRPLFPALLAALKPGGVLIYETFARGNEA